MVMPRLLWVKQAIEFVPGFEQNGGRVQATDERWLFVKGAPTGEE